MARYFLIVLISLSGLSVAEEISASWENPEAIPAPKPDATGRAGQWWWPEQAAENEGDTAAWGNRGVVFGQVKAVEPEVAKEIQVPTEWGHSDGGRGVVNYILFAFDSTSLSETGKSEADKIMYYMVESPLLAIILVGHTCDLGDAAYNQQLGLRRAKAVKDYMVKQGIAEERITTISKGETAPIVPNDGASNRRLNRRAQFHVDVQN